MLVKNKNLFIPHLGISKVGIEILKEGLESSETPPPRSSRSHLNTE